MIRRMDIDFDAVLGELGWSKAELARRLGLDPNTVTRWKQPPGYAKEYLRVMLLIKEALGDQSFRRM